MQANTQVFSQKTHRIKKTDKTAKRRVMAQQAENGRKINNKLSQPRTHRTITKRKDLPVQSYQKVFYPKA